MSDQEKKKSTKGTIAAVIIFILLIFGIAYAILWWDNKQTQKMIDKGCTPKAWNSLGTPSIWSCPVK